jgi:type I restriction enzyme S subunit
MTEPMYKYVFTIPLREAVIAQKGIKPALLEKIAPVNGVPYLDISVLEKGVIKEYTYKELGNVSDENDILVVWDGSRSGLAFLGKYGVIGSTLMSLTPVEFNNEFVYYFIKSQFDFLNGNTTGTSIPHVDSDIFFNLEIPYAPVAQQLYIVNDIKEKIGKNIVFLKQQKDIINAALSKTSINYPQNEDISQSISDFRHSILQNAVSGRLTNQWQNKPSLPIERELNYFPLNNQITSWIVKDGWEFVRLKDVIRSFDYGTSNRSSDIGQIPVLRMGNIQNDKIDWKNLKYSTDLKEIEKYKLVSGDVLFNRTNSPELVGKTAVFDGSRQAIFAGYIIRLVTSELIEILHEIFMRQ